MADTADADQDGCRAGHSQRREAPHRVVGGEAGVRMRRHLRRLDARGELQERALRDDHVVGEAAVDREAGELVPRTEHVVAAPAAEAEAAAPRRIDEHRVAFRDVVTPEPTSSTQPAFS